MILDSPLLSTDKVRDMQERPWWADPTAISPTESLTTQVEKRKADRAKRRRKQSRRKPRAILKGILDR